MSFVISKTVIAGGRNFRISETRYRELAEKVPDEHIPEVNIFAPGWVKYCAQVRDGYIYPGYFWWHGTGASTEVLADEILPAFEGEAEFVSIYEGGECLEGLRLKNGKVTRHGVKFKLDDEPLTERP